MCVGIVLVSLLGVIKSIIDSGWGFIGYKKGISKPHPSDDPIIEARGGVQLDINLEGYCGAVRHSRAVAELDAAFELCAYLLSKLEQARSPSRQKQEWTLQRGDTVAIRPDTQYVIGIMEGKFIPRDNVVLAHLFRHMFRQLSKQVQTRIIWTKGHADD